MTNQLIGSVMFTLVLACAQQAVGRSLGHLVTKETQASKGLEFSLIAVRESDEAVLVQITIPKKGRLQNLAVVRLSLRDGNKILLLAPVDTTDKGDSIFAGFQISPDLAEKCSIDLVTEIGRSETYYMVRLREYITEKK